MGGWESGGNTEPSIRSYKHIRSLLQSRSEHVPDIIVRVVSLEYSRLENLRVTDLVKTSNLASPVSLPKTHSILNPGLAGSNDKIYLTAGFCK